MWPYLLMFAMPALFAVAESMRLVDGRTRLAWAATFAIFTILIGYRFQVGGDWNTYLMLLDRASRSSLDEYIFDGDVSYQLLNWISSRLGWGIYGVNLFTGAIFAFGLVLFCRAQLQPWLAFAVAVPYLIIVVGMGYSRQAAALGCELLALNVLLNKRVVEFVGLIIAAASFHRSAIVLLFLLAVNVNSKRSLIVFTTTLFISGLFMYDYAFNAADVYSKAYIDTAYDSQGATIRLLLNLVPAAIVFASRGRLAYRGSDRRIWYCFSTLSILCLILIFYTPSSTAIDRIALYLLPLQIVVFSRLPRYTAYSFGTSGHIVYSTPVCIMMTTLILLLYGVIEVVWLTQAQTSFAWIPYRSFLIEQTM